MLFVQYVAIMYHESVADHQISEKIKQQNYSQSISLLLYYLWYLSLSCALAMWSALSISSHAALPVLVSYLPCYIIHSPQACSLPSSPITPHQPLPSSLPAHLPQLLINHPYHSSLLSLPCHSAQCLTFTIDLCDSVHCRGSNIRHLL